MASNTVTCDRCGAEIAIGDFPFCPHGRSNLYIDDFPPYFDEHILPEGATISSGHQRRQLMKRNNLDYLGKRLGEPGCEV